MQRKFARQRQEKPSTVTTAINQVLTNATQDRRIELLGKVLGDYRLTSVIGSGGVGTVYQGERADRAYSTQVAVKVLTNAQLSPETQRRFSVERQILANLNHPYVARLLDGGETRFNESFLVMEYVQGQPIDEYCDSQKLTIHQRLLLFIKVCQAVQFAHSNLVVHRDLKPGNILVSKDGTPKLLDFGIAKLLDDSVHAHPQHDALNTRIQDRLLTPEYASPEQIRGQPVTTASDVYSLGVILYELLTGVRPYAVNGYNQLELERSICVIDPVKPSQMLARLAANKPMPMVGAIPNEDDSIPQKPAPDINTISSSRGLSAKRLQHKLNGDLDAILMRALRKEPERRYSSVEQLIEDVQRYLDREPVQARQGNWTYYSSRFMRRHALGVTMSSVALVALVGFAVAMSIQAKRIAEQRDKAKQESVRAESVSNFLQDIFTAADPTHSQDKQVTAKELLDQAAQRITGDLVQQPEVRVRLIEAIGKAYLNQEQISLSNRYLEEALGLQKQLPVKNPLRIAVILDGLAQGYVSTGDFKKASNIIAESRKLLEDMHHEVSQEYLQSLRDSGIVEQRLGHFAIAIHYYEEGLRLSRQINGNDCPETAYILMQLAQVLMWQSDYKQSETLMREAANIYHSTLPEKHPDRVTADLSLAELLYMRGQLPEAADLAYQTVSDQQAIYGINSSRLISSYDTLTKILLGQRKLAEAELSAKKQLMISETSYGKTNIDTGITHSSLANVLLKKAQFTEAENEARTSLKILRATASPDHQYVASAEYLLGASLVGQHKAKQAEPMLRENMARWGLAEAPAWRAARSESVLGNALLQLHKPKEASIALNQAYEVLSAKDSGADADTIAVAKKRVDEYQRCVAEHRENNCQLTE